MSVRLGIRRLIREATGEAKWDDYVAQCHALGIVPMSRRAFERQRAELRESEPPGRCC